MRERIKDAGFWVSLIGAIFLILGSFGVEIGDEVSGSIINSVCSLLVMLGIIKPPPSAVVSVGDMLGEKDANENDNE